MIGLGGMAVCSVFMTISLLLKVSTLGMVEAMGLQRLQVTLVGAEVMTFQVISKVKLEMPKSFIKGAPSEIGKQASLCACNKAYKIHCLMLRKGLL